MEYPGVEKKNRDFDESYSGAIEDLIGIKPFEKLSNVCRTGGLSMTTDSPVNDCERNQQVLLIRDKKTAYIEWQV